MSRKSAYALEARDPAFAAAWIAAAKAAAGASIQGDKEMEGDPFPISNVHTSSSRVERERAFARLVAELRESPPLAPAASAQ